MPIQQPAPAPKFHASIRNGVIAVAPVQLLAVKWANDEGREIMSLVAVFGKSTEPGRQHEPGIFVMAEQDEMIAQFKLPNENLRRGVVAHIAAQSEHTAEEVPEQGIELDGSSPGVPTFDITKMDLG